MSFTHLSGGDLLDRANSPPVVASLRAAWPLTKEATVAGELLFGAPRSDRLGGTTDASVLANLVASGHLSGHHLRWYVAVDNLLDWRWSVPVGEEFVQRAIPQDGRRLRAGMSLEY